MADHDDVAITLSFDFRTCMNLAHGGVLPEEARAMVRAIAERFVAEKLGRTPPPTSAPTRNMGKSVFSDLTLGRAVRFGERVAFVHDGKWFTAERKPAPPTDMTMTSYRLDGTD